MFCAQMKLKQIKSPQVHLVLLVFGAVSYFQTVKDAEICDIETLG